MPSYIIVSKWVGGLGNNLVQLYHSIYLALRLLKAGVKFPGHPFLVGTYLPLRLSAYTAHDIIGEFFQVADVEKLLQAPLPLQPSKMSVFRNFIRPLLQLQSSHRITFRYINHLVMPSTPPLLPPLKDTLVIHIRSGDITNGQNAHPNYVQPPLSFYLRVIATAHQQHVIIVTQDLSNPTVCALQDNLPSVEVYWDRSLLEDTTTILRAQHLCYGKSWLPVTLALMSENVQTIHILDDMHNADFIPSSSSCHIIHYQLTQPYIPVGQWQNTDSQRMQMLTYPMDAVVKK